MKEETTNISLRALNIGALTTLGTFGCTNQEDDDDKPGLAHTLSGSYSGQAILRSEQ
jgi:hypothetical protein